MPFPQHRWLGFRIQMPLMPLISYCGSTLFNFSKVTTAVRKHLCDSEIAEILISIYAAEYQISLRGRGWTDSDGSTLISESSNKFIYRGELDPPARAEATFRQSVRRN